MTLALYDRDYNVNLRYHAFHANTSVCLLFSNKLTMGMATHLGWHFVYHTSTPSQLGRK